MGSFGKSQVSRSGSAKLRNERRYI